MNAFSLDCCLLDAAVAATAVDGSLAPALSSSPEALAPGLVGLAGLGSSSKMAAKGRLARDSSSMKNCRRRMMMSYFCFTFHRIEASIRRVRKQLRWWKRRERELVVSFIKGSSNSPRESYKELDKVECSVLTEGQSDNERIAERVECDEE